VVLPIGVASSELAGGSRILDALRSGSLGDESAGLSRVLRRSHITPTGDLGFSLRMRQGLSGYCRARVLRISPCPLACF
jgi:hypothetical protein